MGEILRAEPPSILEYRVKSGLFPVHYHRGRVEFEQRGSKTLVTWTCSYTPMFCLGPLVSQIVKVSFGIMLQTLSDSVTGNSKRRSLTLPMKIGLGVGAMFLMYLVTGRSKKLY